jgi:hypothetical protein
MKSARDSMQVWLHSVSDTGQRHEAAMVKMTLALHDGKVA